MADVALAAQPARHVTGQVAAMKAAYAATPQLATLAAQSRLVSMQPAGELGEPKERWAIAAGSRAKTREKKRERGEGEGRGQGGHEAVNDQ